MKYRMDVFFPFLFKRLWPVKIAAIWIVASFLFTGIVSAELKGQIINVNQSYQIAFTDLGNSSLKQGDLVKVLLDNTDFVYMEVLETSAILSKLGPTHHEIYKTNVKEFARVSVGSAVVKITEADEIKKPLLEQGPEPAIVSSAEVQKLQSQLASAMSEIQNLKAANEELRKQAYDLNIKLMSQPASVPTKDNANSNELLRQLKLRLEKMDKTLNQ